MEPLIKTKKKLQQKFLGPNYVNALEQLSAGTVYAGNNKLPVLVCDHTQSQKYHVQRLELQGAPALITQCDQTGQE